LPPENSIAQSNFVSQKLSLVSIF